MIRMEPLDLELLSGVLLVIAAAYVMGVVVLFLTGSPGGVW